MEIIIHRGTHQIGGCVTELRSGKSRIFVDCGKVLPNPDGTPNPDTLSIPGLTEGTPDCDGVLFTHTHGDHIGKLDEILDGIPIYMGADGQKMMLVLHRHLQDASRCAPEVFGDQTRTLEKLNRAVLFSNLQPTFPVGNFRITPIRVDHSAFDSYMFLIEAEGLKILHTGDFRNHGYHGKDLTESLARAGPVDYLISEGTMLSRGQEVVLTEQELAKKARALMEEHENVFVLCSSTNIDRIRTFYQAKPHDRPAVCDQYQKNILNVATESGWGAGCDFHWAIPKTDWNYKLDNWMSDKGFLMFVRATDKFQNWMEPYRKDGVLVYSMWSGYRSNPRIQSFMAGWKTETLHTGGHATREALETVIRTVTPGYIVPIHTESPEEFGALDSVGADILYLKDGETLTLSRPACP